MASTFRWLFQKFGSERDRWSADLPHRRLEMGFQAQIIVDAHDILAPLHAVFFQPLGADVDTARALGHRLTVKLLPFFAQEPVDENLRRIRMRRIFHDSY